MLTSLFFCQACVGPGQQSTSIIDPPESTTSKIKSPILDLYAPSASLAEISRALQENADIPEAAILEIWLDRLSELLHGESRLSHRSQAHDLTLKIYALQERHLDIYQYIFRFPTAIQSNLKTLLNACVALEFHSCISELLSHLESQSLPKYFDDEQLLRSVMAAEQNKIDEQLLLVDQELQPFIFQKDEKYTMWNSLKNILMNSGSREKTASLARLWLQENEQNLRGTELSSLLKKLDSFEPNRIALILPLSKEYGVVGRAVRDGFFDAFLTKSEPPRESDPHPRMRDKVVLIDSEKNSVKEIILKLEKWNPTVILGPLLKPKAEQIAQTHLVDNVPTVLLNRINTIGFAEESGETSRQLLQLLTPIEDEAIALAKNMTAYGYQNALVVHNQETWAQRSLDAFRQNWRGSLETSFFRDIRNITGAIGQGMKVSESVEREKRLSSIINAPLEFVPRSRKDLDSAVVFSSNLELSAIMPALKFHFADQLPVYTTSQSKRGSYENPRVKSTELPLNLPETHVNSSGFASWSSLSDNNEVDFFALGQSAFEIAGWAPLLYRDQKWRELFYVNSAIGGLQVDDFGRLSRSVTVQ